MKTCLVMKYQLWKKKKRSGLLGDHRTPGGFGGLAMGAGPVNWQTNWATSKQNSNFDSKKNDSKLVLGSLLSENHSFRMHSWRRLEKKSDTIFKKWVDAKQNGFKFLQPWGTTNSDHVLNFTVQVRVCTQFLNMSPFAFARQHPHQNFETCRDWAPDRSFEGRHGSRCGRGREYAVLYGWLSSSLAVDSRAAKCGNAGSQRLRCFYSIITNSREHKWHRYLSVLTPWDS